VRYPNACEDARVVRSFYPDGDFKSFGVRADFPLESVPRNVVVAFGHAVSRALDAAEAARAEGMSVGVVLVERIKPYDACADTLLPYLAGAERVIFFEEGIASGGAAASLLAAAREKDRGVAEAVRTVAIRDSFAAPDKLCDLYEFAGVSAGDILCELIP
jgi:transketolase C-terminal domain/subunit